MDRVYIASTPIDTYDNAVHWMIWVPDDHQLNLLRTGEKSQSYKQKQPEGTACSDQNNRNPLRTVALADAADAIRASLRHKTYWMTTS